MLGFILSKMNLLILVVSIFAIVAFFTFGLIDIVKVKETQLLLDRVLTKASSVASSPAYCFSDSHTFPRSLDVSGQEFYYVMKISVTQFEKELPSGPETISKVIFSVFPRRDLVKSINDPSYIPKAIAAKSFETKAEVTLFSQDYLGDEYGGIGTLRELATDTGESVYIDPQARVPMDSIQLVKEIKRGQSSLYIFPCSVGPTCNAIKSSVGESVYPGVGFTC